MCGSSTCFLRTMLRTTERPPPEVALTGKALDAARLAEPESVTISARTPAKLTVQSVCGAPPPVQVAVCGAEALANRPECGLALLDSQDAVMDGLELVRPACTDLASCTYTCTYARALQGRCPVGVHAFIVAAVNSARDLSQGLPITVRLQGSQCSICQPARKLSVPVQICLVLWSC